MPVTWGAMTVGDRRLARLLNSFPEIVVVLDGSGNVLWANHLAEVLFDRPLESSIGMSGIDLVHPDDLEIVLRSLETVQSKSVGAPLEIRRKSATTGGSSNSSAHRYRGSRRGRSSSVSVTLRIAGASNWLATTWRVFAPWSTTDR